MRSYETRNAVLLKTYLASDIKVPIISFMRIYYDVYDLACIQLFFSVIIYGHVALPYFYASVHANVMYTIQSRINKTNYNE